MNVRRLLLAAVAFGAFAVPEPTSAGCAGPTVSATPKDRRAGQLVLVAGEGWTAVCDDQGEMCSGCVSCSPGDDNAPAIERIVLELVPRDGPPIELHTIDLPEFASFAEELRLPADLEPGRYKVRATGMPGKYVTTDPLTIVD